ncbi:hypothetical protein CFC21_057910 [Triticum aestivum]|uniref:Myb/SANT-like DNA-binding domain-containing protein n=2 Tax=Triticum aestivum TaxID=4565 RepID=A0A9R1KCT4_WHEAT|nr:trihelix transcription factor ASIL1-like [Triticum aestivum]KAF7049356.1 hypothetical protein CFC21_057909 [Triticum aestivum]KAF7049357.1 hypothetical protein CFC21_057910 [Triticum aestivum]
MTSRKTGPGAGGRWSDGETSALLDAWGQIYLRRNRSSLRMDDWLTVCRAVNAHRGDLNRTLAQCRTRLCTLKQKYKVEVAKGLPALGSPHLARLRGFLADSKFSNGPPPGFDGKTPAAAVKMEEEEEKEEEEGEEEASGCVGGSTGRSEVPVKRQRHFSSLRDILERSGDPSLAKTPATVCCGCELVGGSATGVTKLVAEIRKVAEVHERVEMERHKFKKEMQILKMMELKDVRLEHKKVKENPKEADGK